MTVAKYKEISSYVRTLTPRPRSKRSIVIRKVVDGGGELIFDSLPCILGELPPMRDKVSLELVNCSIMAPSWRIWSRRGTSRGVGDTTRQTVTGNSHQSSADDKGKQPQKHDRQPEEQEATFSFQNIVADPSWAVRILLIREIKANKRKEEKVRAATKKLREATENLRISNKRLEAALLLCDERGPGNPMTGKATTR